MNGPLPCAKSTAAREYFVESVRRDFEVGKDGSKLEAGQSHGTLIAKVTRFNSVANSMKGVALMTKGEEEWLWEVEGDPALIDQRLGGHAKRLRERSSESEDARRPALLLPEAHGSLDNGGVMNTGRDGKPDAHQSGSRLMLQAFPGAKRSRASEPLLASAAPPALAIEVAGECPSHNTRSQAGGRGRASSARGSRQTSGSRPREAAKTANSKRKGKGKPQAESDPKIVEITAGIDGFSVFSNNESSFEVQEKTQVEGPAYDKAFEGVDAADWAHSITHSVKVGEWLEHTAGAGTPAPADAPRSRAPSTVTFR